MSDQIRAYAEAIYNIAAAENALDAVKSELTSLASAVAGNEELRAALGNNLLPAATRTQIVDDVLANKSSGPTQAIAGMIAAAGRGGQFSEIVDAFVARSAESQGKQVATVRSAVALTDDQQARLTQALKTSTGADVELQVIIDPSVVGGAVTNIGDTVIDGSLRTRLNQMRDAL